MNWLVIAIIAAGGYFALTSDLVQANREQRRLDGEAEARSRQTPHIISQKDGCTIYRFENAGRWHYFTRCATQTTTETTLPDGKSTRSSVIVTPNIPRKL